MRQRQLTGIAPALRVDTFLCDIAGNWIVSMNREALIRELRKLAREQDKIFEIFTNRGKGSHYRVRFGDRMTTIQSGELSNLHVRTIRKQLGIE